jgi:hypothetical protein
MLRDDSVPADAGGRENPMVPDRHDSRLAPCPRCRHSDSILSVPAAYASARSTEAATRAIRDNEVRVTVNAALPIVAARDLAMAPDGIDPNFGCLTVFLGIAAIGAPIVYEYGTDHQNGDSVLLVVGAAAGLLFVLCIFLLSLALARQPKIKAGKPAAEAVWRLGWYCCRCAVVYFQAGEEPSGVTSGQPLTPAHFRHIVWTAGRYDGLA